MVKQSIVCGMVIAATFAARPLQAHHGPEEMIAMLTRRMEAGSSTPVLLYKRAMEWRTLGKLKNAAADLNQALELNPEFIGGIELLAEIYLMQGNLEKAESTANTGITASKAGNDRAACQMALARTLAESGKTKAALAASNAAFQSYPRGNIDWYLIRGTLQRQLGMHAERVADFRDGYEETHSVVLRNLMVDAMIDAGQANEVMPVIDEQIAACRLKSSWLLRRARALHSLGKSDLAREDLDNALKELNRRIHPIRPDVTLVIDRGLARAMLGDTDGANEDLKKARELDVSPAMLVLLEEALSSMEVNQTSESAERS